jgi:hypothetical protein
VLHSHSPPRRRPPVVTMRLYHYSKIPWTRVEQNYCAVDVVVGGGVVSPSLKKTLLMM